MLSPGKKSSEFLVVVGLFALVIASALGWLKPETVHKVTGNINETAGALPALIQAVKDLAQSHGDILVYAGVAWAYLKRRSALKGKELEKGGEVK